MHQNHFNYTCSKQFQNYPCSHRQWRHPGRCRFVHGYSRSFRFWFAAKELDLYGFVVDFSSLKPLEAMLKENFDHTFLVNSDDPLLPEWKSLHAQGALDLKIMENVGMEYTSKFIWEWSNTFLRARDKGRTCVWRAMSQENDSNSAIYEQTPDWFKLN